MTHQIFYIPSGSTAYIGRPQNPFNQSLLNAISTFAANIPSLIEAHVPQIFIPGVMDQPGQVLVIQSNADSLHLNNSIADLQNKLIEQHGLHLDVLPLRADSPLWVDIRSQRMQIGHRLK